MRPGAILAPSVWTGNPVRHGDPPIPVTVKVTWDDGTTGEVNAWTGQWTKTHVYVYRKRRRRTTGSGCEPAR
jgi:hypothetical protein